MKKVLKNIIDHIIDFLALLAAGMIIFVMLSVGVDVVMRYFLNRPMLWVGEITEYCLLFITFAATAWVLKKEGHVVMDILVVRLNKKRQSFLNTSTSILGAFISLIIAFFSAKVTWDFFRSGAYESSVLEPPKYILYIIIPVGSFFLFIQFIRRVFMYASVWKESRSK
ncbi:MAG: TRAP transporter small permease [Deltaproteobacteria bacterium]|nr:TRAP transporter small permease [Deltaproteobacteria bacterium]